MRKFKVASVKGNKLEMSPELEKLEFQAFKERAIFLSSIGRARIGKSSSLNCYLREICSGAPEVLFKTEDGPDSVTQGIDMIIVPYSKMKKEYQKILFKINEEEIDLVLLDCEGTGISEGYEAASTFFATCCLVSSVIHIQDYVPISKDVKDMITSITESDKNPQSFIKDLHTHFLIQHCTKETFKLYVPPKTFLLKQKGFQEVLSKFAHFDLHPIMNPEYSKPDGLAEVISNTSGYYKTLKDSFLETLQANPPARSLHGFISSINQTILELYLKGGKLQETIWNITSKNIERKFLFKLRKLVSEKLAPALFKERIRFSFRDYYY